MFTRNAIRDRKEEEDMFERREHWHAACVFPALFLAILFSGACLNAAEHGEAHLKVSNIRIEPIHQGKNSVLMDVENSTATGQELAAAIQTLSPHYGRGLGWGTTFFETINAHTTKSVRFVFKLNGPLTDDSWVRLRFYNPPARTDLDFKAFFLERKWFAKDLAHAETAPDDWGAAPSEDRDRSESVLAGLQSALRAKDYDRAWTFFSKDYRDVEYFGRIDAFKKNMEGAIPNSYFSWEREALLAMRPETAGKRGAALLLKAHAGGESWVFILSGGEGGNLAVDGIEGFTPRTVLQADWQERLLPTMKARRSAHLDIFYGSGSTAEKEIETIVAQRERGFALISEFLGVTGRERLRLVFFEDGRTKQYETGHQGMGWAFGNTMVEVYNAEEKLDPFHEMVHILAGPIGDPPAAFKEGLAVFLSERLGAQALAHLGGGRLTIGQRVSQIRQAGPWIGLEELLTYPDIGPDESRPEISYPEAASFVEFLIRQYGKDKFLEAYRTLKSPASKDDVERNARKLAGIFGRTVRQLEADWKAGL